MNDLRYDEIPPISDRDTLPSPAPPPSSVPTICTYCGFSTRDGAQFRVHSKECRACAAEECPPSGVDRYLRDHPTALRILRELAGQEWGERDLEMLLSIVRGGSNR